MQFESWDFKKAANLERKYSCIQNIFTGYFLRIFLSIIVKLEGPEKESVTSW